MIVGGTEQSVEVRKVEVGGQGGVVERERGALLALAQVTEVPVQQLVHPPALLFECFDFGRGQVVLVLANVEIINQFFE